MAALFNPFKKKEEKVKPIEEKVETSVKKEVKEPVKKTVKKQAISEIYQTVLQRPRITEKASNLAELRQYVFEVAPTATKEQVKIAVQKLYNVNVEKVGIVNIPRKKTRLGKTLGWKKGFKKAIVKVKEGQHIEVMPK